MYQLACVSYLIWEYIVYKQPLHQWEFLGTYIKINYNYNHIKKEGLKFVLKNIMKESDLKKVIFRVKISPIKRLLEPWSKLKPKCSLGYIIYFMYAPVINTSIDVFMPQFMLEYLGKVSTQKYRVRYYTQNTVPHSILYSIVYTPWYLDDFHFRWLNIKGFDAELPIAITLFFDHLNWNWS